MTELDDKKRLLEESLLDQRKVHYFIVLSMNCNDIDDICRMFHQTQETDVEPEPKSIPVSESSEVIREPFPVNQGYQTVPESSVVSSSKSQDIVETS